MTGGSDDLGGGPQKVGVAVADLFLGMFATVAVLAALRHAERMGQGQQVDMALLDAQVAMLTPASGPITSFVGGKVPGRMGNAHPERGAVSGFWTLRQRLDVQKDRLITAVGNDGQFVKFCAIAGRPDLATDPQTTKNQDRVRNRCVLVPLLQEILLPSCSPGGETEWLSALGTSQGAPPLQSIPWVRCFLIRMCRRGGCKSYPTGNKRSMARCRW
ncbi:MAG: CoA transferase [Betaproteobacteria bacterium]|nr:CoA transferase [Betaproteobacteria bacterium]